MRTIEQGVTVFSSSEIRVALLPVGPVPQEVLQEYCELIERYRHVDLTAVRSFYHEKQKSPLKYLPWNEGSMHFRFVQEKSATQVSPLTSLHASRAILGVIGVCHCPSSPDISLAYSEFEKMAKQFSSAAALRCFAFQPLGDEQQESKKNEHLVMFPPGDETHIEQHVEVLMHDFAACVLMELQQQMLRTTIGSMSLVTTIDEPSFSGVLGITDDASKKLGSEEEVRQRRRHTRLEKRLGDWCLLAGSPKDAMEHYASCTEIAKMSGDVVWSAAALEGLAESKVIEALVSAGTIPGSKNDDAGASPPDSPASEVATPMSKALRLESSMGFGGMSLWRVIKQTSELENQVEGMCSSAGHVYQRRGILPLQIEVELKRVRFTAGLHGKAARAQVSDILTQVMDQWPLLNSEEDRVNVVVEAAQVLGLVGCYRKRVLLIWQALEAVRNLQRSDILLLDSALKSLDPPGDHENQDKGEFRRMEWSLGNCGLPHKEWYLLQRAMLEALLPTASRAGSQVYVWEACAALLRDHHAALSADNQSVLMEAMKKASEALDPLNRMRPGPGPPPLFQVRVVSALRPDLRPINVFRSQDTTGPFLFSPLAQKRAKEQNVKIKWVVGEECSLEVYIANPTSLETRLERLSLYGTMEDDGIGGKGYQKVPVSVVLPAKTKPTRVSLAIVPHTPGVLNVTGVLVTLFGVTWLQKFVPNLKRVALPEGSSLVKLPKHRRETHMMVAVEVLPQMPLLKLEFLGAEFEEFDSQVPTSSPNASGKDADQPKIQVVTVFEGQVLECTLKITNCSKVPVSKAVIECKQPQNSGDVLGITVNMLKSKLHDALPLVVGGTVEVPVSLKVGCSKAAPSVMSPLPLEIILQYSGPAEEDGNNASTLGREARMNIQFRSLPAIELVSLKLRNEYVLNGTAAMNTHSPSTSLSSLSYRCVIDLDVVNHMDNVVDLWLELFDNQKEGKEVPLCDVQPIEPRAVITVSCTIPQLEVNKLAEDNSKIVDQVAGCICSKIQASWSMVRAAEVPQDGEQTDDPAANSSCTDPSISLKGIVQLPQRILEENISPLMLGKLSRRLVMVSVGLVEKTQNKYKDISPNMPQLPVEPLGNLNLSRQTTLRHARSTSVARQVPQDSVDVAQPSILNTSKLSYEPSGPMKEVWGVTAALGEIVECEMVVENDSNENVSLCLTLCSDAVGPEASIGDPINTGSGLLILGVVGNILLDVAKGTVKQHRFSVCPTTTGVFEVFACGEICSKGIDSCDNELVHGMKLNLCSIDM